MVDTFAAFVLIVILILLVYYRFGYAPYQVFKKMGVPGPEPKIFWGNAQEMMDRTVIGAYKHFHNTYGPVLGFYIGRRPVLYIADIQMLKDILVKEFDSFVDREDNPVSVFTQFGLPLDLLQAPGNTWRNARHHITPTFSSNKIKMMIPLVQESCSELLQKIRAIADAGTSIDMWRVFGAFTLETILSVAFGRVTNIQAGAEDRLTEAISTFFAISRHNARLHPLKGIAIISHFPFLKSIQHYLLPADVRQDLKYIVTTTLAIIEERRRQMDKIMHKDFLQLMLEAGMKPEEEEEEDGSVIDKETSKRKPLTDGEVASYCITFLLAGYETTANTLAFTAYLLAVNPEVQEKLCMEIDHYCQQNPDATISDVSREVTYLDMVLQESLRIYPPGARTFRHAARTVTISGITIPKKMRILIPIIVLHHSKAFWEDPEVFRPERFSAEEKAKRPQLCHMPFGWGPRNCIGMRFALMEAKMALASILMNYKFVQAPETEVPLQISVGITLSPINGVYLKVMART